jgi:hypothetical protein
MKVICAWCHKEGKPAFVREKAPLTDTRETHGVCPAHLAWLETHVCAPLGIVSQLNLNQPHT